MTIRKVQGVPCGLERPYEIAARSDSASLRIQQLAVLLADRVTFDVSAPGLRVQRASVGTRDVTAGFAAGFVLPQGLTEWTFAKPLLVQPSQPFSVLLVNLSGGCVWVNEFCLWGNVREDDAAGCCYVPPGKEHWRK